MPDTYDRSDDMRLILQTLDRIDERTDNMDARLRDVEQKINNGLSHNVATTTKIVAEMKIEQERIKSETQALRLAEERRRTIAKWIAGIGSGLIVAVAGVLLKLFVGG